MSLEPMSLTNVSEDRIHKAINVAKVNDTFIISTGSIDLVKTAAKHEDMKIQITYDPRVHSLDTGDVCEVKVLE
jgi:nitrate reductase beta subunit